MVKVKKKKKAKTSKLQRTLPRKYKDNPQNGREYLQITYLIRGFPDSSLGKESACNAGNPDSIPGSGRSAEEGIGYPLQYSWVPGGSVGKEFSCNVGDLGSTPGLGRSLGEGKGYPLQYSGLENFMDVKDI